MYTRKVKAVTKTSSFTCIIKTSGIYPKTSCKTNNKKTKNKQTLSAPPLAEEEVPEGSGGGGAAVLSKSSSAPVEKARQFDIDWCVGEGVVAPTDANKVTAGGTLSSSLGYLLFQ